MGSVAGVPSTRCRRRRLRPRRALSLFESRSIHGEPQMNRPSCPLPQHLISAYRRRWRLMPLRGPRVPQHHLAQFDVPRSTSRALRRLQVRRCPLIALDQTLGKKISNSSHFLHQLHRISLPSDPRLIPPRQLSHPLPHLPPTPALSSLASSHPSPRLGEGAVHRRFTSARRQRAVTRSLCRGSISTSRCRQSPHSRERSALRSGMASGSSRASSAAQQGGGARCREEAGVVEDQISTRTLTCRFLDGWA